MNSVVSVCEKCGAAIPADARQGVCPACQLETGLDLLRHQSVIGGEDVNLKLARTPARSPLPGAALPSTLPNPSAPFMKSREFKAEGARMHTDFGDYEVQEEIGRGGQGVVYRARQKTLNRAVALKVIGLGHWAREEHVRRFRLEAEAAASLNHPCIVPIYEIGERDGSCYFSMGLVQGGPLGEVVKNEPMAQRKAAELIAKLARTVQYAHEHGILHRDIKPGNILLDAKGEPHLTDFGLARLVETESTVTRTTEVVGTPSYMAPEQAVGNKGQLTRATDVYGLGAVLYHLLTGNPPFVGGTTYETTRLLLETEPCQPRLLNPKVDRDLATICLKCMEKDPERRYSSALAVAEDLERWLKYEPIQARRAGVWTHGQKWVRRNPTSAALAASLIALLGAVGMIVWKSELFHRPPTTGIAVLPFENLSNDREDASFADGVQDDLLTKLANVAALKVISRTSVMEYRGKHNTRQIGDALRVSHVLEGSVRKTGSWLHINAQLIDARTDTHVWAKQYDGDLKDVFAIQTEIAQNVAQQLHVKVSAAEKAAIEEPPTADLTAFDLYSRARNVVLMTSFGMNVKANLLEAVDLLNHAVGHDPSFFQAYCQLARIHGVLYSTGYDHTAARLGLADAAVETALRLRPDAGEAHLARAANLYRGHLDYHSALAELKIARQRLPNDPEVLELQGYIDRRQRRWEDSVRNLERAIDLDPLNFSLLQQASVGYDFLHRYRDEESVFGRMLMIKPNDAQTRISRASLELDWKADTQPLRQLLRELRVNEPAQLEDAADAWLMCALSERDTASAKDALIALRETSYSDYAVQLSCSFLEGLVARMMNDDEQAQLAFASARAQQEKIVQAQPTYGPALCVMGLIDAGLGRKEEALREGRRAVELLPVEKDGLNGTLMIKYLAVIAAWFGDHDLACEQLTILNHQPNNLHYGDLKLMPWWDPLRGDPRFEKIVASLAPKEN